MGTTSRRLLACYCFAAVALTSLPSQAETLRIGGSGIALAAMGLVGESLAISEPNLKVEVLPSLSTPGGIKALMAGELDIAISSRPLTPDELSKTGGEMACLTTALVIVTSHKTATGLTRSQLAEFYTDPQPKWPDGTPLKVILRLRDSPTTVAIATAVPGFVEAYQTAHKRQGPPVAATDQDNADLARRTNVSLAFMTLLQRRAERLDLKPLTLDGVAPSLATVADNTYPMNSRVCFLHAASPNPIATRFMAHLKSPAGQDLMRSLGAMPTD